MSSRVKLVAVLSTVLLVAACAEPTRYPVSGAQCGPDDPVGTMDSSRVMDCVPSL